MSFPTRSLSTHLRTSSHPNAGSQNQSPALQMRVEEKKAELENLRQLRDLSAAVAGQMEALAERVTTLSDGTEAIATVVGNWHNVLRAINMASTKLPKPRAGDEAAGVVPEQEEAALPQTLVRIPTEHAPTLQAQAEAATAEEGT